MSAIHTIHVRGQGAAAWLAAVTLARFVAAEPADVSIEAIPGDDVSWGLRPSSAKLHAAIGLDPVRLGQHVSDAELAVALKATAKRIGIRETQGDADITVVTDVADSLWRGREVAVGRAALPTSLPGELGMHILHETLMALVESFPSAELFDVERQEYVRRVEAIAPNIREMEMLKAKAEPDARLEHRLRVWQGTGRVIPTDHDPFTKDEWIAAMRAAGVEAQGRSLLEAVRG